MAAIFHRHTLGIAATGVLLLLLVVAGVPVAHTVQAHSSTAACPALGTYTLNRPFPPPLVQAPRGSNQLPPTYAYPYWWTGALSGTITLSSYSACGVPTAGSFSVHLTRFRYGGPLPEVPQNSRTAGGTAIAVPLPILAGTTVLTATGTIAQDAAHANDGTYTTVGATIIYGRETLSCPPLCGAQPEGGTIRCVPVACEPSEVVTRTATFSGITGYLRVQPGTPYAVALSFLPPPDPKAQSIAAMQTSLQPINLLGTHTGP